MVQKVSVTEIVVGDSFGRWRVLERLSSRGHGTKRLILCECAVDLGGCGAVREVTGAHLARGATNSCGCLMRELASSRVRVKKPSKIISPEVRTWRDIINRCYNVTNSSYPRYGANGTYVCDGWRHDQHKFVADMGPKTTPEHSIDRVNSKGHYSCGTCDHCRRVGAPMNCRWATDDEQANNVSRNRMLTHNGETMTVTDWTRRIGCSPAAIFGRLDRGWTVEQALGTPMLRHGLKRKWEEERGTMIAATSDAVRSEPTKQRNPCQRRSRKAVTGASEPVA